MLQEARAVSLNDYLKPICSNYRYWAPTEKTVRAFLTEKKAIRVSCTTPINNNCCPLLRVMRCTQPNFTKGGGGRGAPPRCPIPFLLCIISGRKGTSFGTRAIDKWYPFHISSLELCISLQWRIQGRGPGGPGPPLSFDQNGVHNQILLRAKGGGGGGWGGSAPVSHPFSFMHHFWQKRYPLWNTCY